MPFEFSPQMKLTWVRQGYETIRQIAITVDSTVIVGISYQPSDRYEINSIIGEIPADTQIRLVAPNPNAEFERKLREVSDKAERTAPQEFLDDIT